MSGGVTIFQSIQDVRNIPFAFGVSHHFDKETYPAFPSKSGFCDNSAEIELKIGSFYEFSATAKIVVLISQAKGPKILSLLMLEKIEVESPISKVFPDQRILSESFFNHEINVRKSFGLICPFLNDSLGGSSDL